MVEWETVLTLIRLLLEEQFDLGLHCLLRPLCPNSWKFHCNCFGGLKAGMYLSLVINMSYERDFDI